MTNKTLFRIFLLTALLSLFSGFTVLADDFGPGYTGWHQETDGSWKYYTNGTPLRSTSVTVDGVTYVFDADGKWVENPSSGNSGTGTAGQAEAQTGTQSGAQDASQTQTGSESQTNPGQTADAAALARGSVSEKYANRANPYPQYPDVVEIDIANQHVFCYKNNVLMWDSYCVTGCVQDGHSTPEGVFQIQAKERSRYLQGPVDPATGKRKWKNWVEYWMPFHNGCGLHDASWRSKFAGTIYTYGGSHGCVNLPVEKTPELYNLVYVGMPVVVHP